MIRFVDLTPFYYCDTDASNPPVCAFLDTATDDFIDIGGQQTASDDEDLDFIEDADLAERCRRLVPDGFWERKTCST